MAPRSKGDVLGSRRWAEPVTSDAHVVIAASAGGLEAIGAVLAALPYDFPAAVSIVQHRGQSHPELLPNLLGARTALRVRHARDGDRLRAGTVYVCPPGMHMTVERCVRLVAGPRIDHVRPSADLMFQSVASVYGERALGVVLTGEGSDGAAGARVLAAAGATVIAQDPAGSAHPSMPAAAVRSGAVEWVLPLEQIGERVRCLVEAAAGSGPRPDVVSVTTVLIVDDHRIMVDGLHTLLELEHDIEVVGDAADGRAAAQLTEQLRPDVVVMDVAMPGLNGIDATRRIKARSPDTLVIALSARTDVRTISAVLHAGAMGFLSKNDAFDELAHAIRAVAGGRRYLSRSIAPLVGDSARVASAPPERVSLDDTEREVLQRMAEGEPDESIAAVLGIDEADVAAHGTAIMEKLGLANMAALTRYAIREGLTSVEL